MADNVNNIIGLSRLINQSKVAPGFDAAGFEQKIVSGQDRPMVMKDVDPAKEMSKFTDSLEKFSGAPVSKKSVAPKPGEVRVGVANSNYANSVGLANSNSSNYTNSAPVNSGSAGYTRVDGVNSVRPPAPVEIRPSMESNYYGGNNPVNRIERTANDFGLPSVGVSNNGNYMPGNNNWNGPSQQGGYQNFGYQADYSYGNNPTLTNDMIRSNLAAYTGVGSMNAGQTETQMISYKEDIMRMRREMALKHVNCDDLPVLHGDVSFREIEISYKHHKKRYDTMSYGTMAEELGVSIARGLGYFFDGTRSIGPFTPYLKGWDKTARQQLRELRPDSAEVIGTLLGDSMGALTKIMLRIVPSAVIYSTDNANRTAVQSYTPGAYTQQTEDGPRLEGTRDL